MSAAMSGTSAPLPAVQFSTGLKESTTASWVGIGCAGPVAGRLTAQAGATIAARTIAGIGFMRFMISPVPSRPSGGVVGLRRTACHAIALVSGSQVGITLAIACCARIRSIRRSRGRISRTGTLDGVERCLGLGLRRLVSRFSLVLARLLRIASQRFALFLRDLALAIGLRNSHVVLGGGTVLGAFFRYVRGLMALFAHVLLRVLASFRNVLGGFVRGFALVAAGKRTNAHRCGHC